MGGRVPSLIRVTAAVNEWLRRWAGFQSVSPIAGETDLCIKREHLGARGLGFLPGEGFSLRRRPEVALGAGKLAHESRQLLPLGRDSIGGVAGSLLCLVCPCAGLVGLQIHLVVALASGVERCVRQQVRQILYVGSARPRASPGAGAWASRSVGQTC